MSNSIKENINTDIFPYDFVKENEVIAFQNGEGILVSSPKPISLNLYQEIQRFLNSDFRFELCDSNKFNEILTNSFTSSCLLYTSPSPRDLSTSRMPSSA